MLKPILLLMLLISGGQDNRKGGYALSGMITTQKTGAIYLCITPSASTDSAIASMKIPVAQSGRVPFRFENVPAGRYAIRAWQDVNGNGRLDTGFMKMPKEPWGNYRSTRPRFGAPKWEDMVFTVEGSMENLDFEVK